MIDKDKYLLQLCFVGVFHTSTGKNRWFMHTPAPLLYKLSNMSENLGLHRHVNCACLLHYSCEVVHL